MDFSLWDVAIAARLKPIRDQLTIPVAALPKEAGKFGSEEFQSIDWLFPSYSASPPDGVGDRLQPVQVSLVVRLYFQKRYPQGTEKDALEWAETQVISLLAGHRLPNSTTPLSLESGKLYAPQQGQWYKEINFGFNARVIPGDVAIAPYDPVKEIGLTDQNGALLSLISN